jgi:hypothetical protein
MDTLAALCDILSATPNDLIEVRAVNVQVAKAAGGARPWTGSPASSPQRLRF